MVRLAVGALHLDQSMPNFGVLDTHFTSVWQYRCRKTGLVELELFRATVDHHRIRIHFNLLDFIQAFEFAWPEVNELTLVEHVLHFLLGIRIPQTGLLVAHVRHFRLVGLAKKGVKAIILVEHVLHVLLWIQMPQTGRLVAHVHLVQPATRMPQTSLLVVHVRLVRLVTDLGEPELSLLVVHVRLVRQVTDLGEPELSRRVHVRLGRLLVELELSRRVHVRLVRLATDPAELRVRVALLPETRLKKPGRGVQHEKHV